MSIKVLVVDDSALLRKVLSNVLNDCRGIEVIDVARNGIEAMKIIEKAQPDLITLDVEMPMMNGLETLKAIKESYTIPVIMLSSKTNEETTIQALELGAEDFVEKPVSIQKHWNEFRNELSERIHVHFSDEEHKAIEVKKHELLNNTLLSKKKQLKAIVIGASTGGPKALVKAIQGISSHLSVPVFIVQHMPEGFTSSFAKRLDTAASVPVVEAVHGQKIRAGTVYLAPGAKHMTIKEGTLELDTRPKIHGVRPAVDYLFETAAHTYGENILAIILTGMGKDGAPGCEVIKNRGGYILTQDKDSSIVYGMPRVVVERGLSDQSASINEIADILREMTR
ncbi:MAG: chemotaxis response regulator protein-glutamate methylesterase [Alkalibacterium sp.]|nr:chemotaxis response regulator protein-glutamate methylesterase [Alkalibacterium sp.]